jgi:hypothetical protein
MDSGSDDPSPKRVDKLCISKHSIRYNILLPRHRDWSLTHCRSAGGI